MINIANMQLGKLPHIPKARDMHLRAYLDRAKAEIDLNKAPGAINWYEMATPTGGLPGWDGDVLGNDKYGDCVYAAIAHALMLQSKLAGIPMNITTQMVLNEYQIGTGFDPATGYNDNGALLREALDRGRQVGLFGVKIDAYLYIDPLDKLELNWALWSGGGLLYGFSLPKRWSEMVDDSGNPDWTVPDGGWKAGEGPGEGGGHAVAGHASNGGNSWGLPTNWSDEFRQVCCDEMIVFFSSEWSQRNGKTPCGLDYSQVLADARARGAR